jgi:hypothetical protein
MTVRPSKMFIYELRAYFSILKQYPSTFDSAKVHILPEAAPLEGEQLRVN